MIIIPVSSNSIMEFDPHSLLTESLLDCIFAIGLVLNGLQMIEPGNSKEFGCPEKSDCGAELYGFG